MRIIDDRYRVTELEIRTRKASAWLVSTALYCDVYALPWNFLSKAKKMGERGGVLAVDALNALFIIERQICPYDKKELKKNRDHIMKIAIKNLSTIKKFSPLWFDLLLALYLNGLKEKIPRGDFTLLAGSQNFDGSWLNDDELTAKVLWILLMEKTGYKPGMPFELTRKSGF
ncbi:MAG TPA: hypothetical protein PLY93_04375 [Turneriella sp.]|nr:hypothetical protein [Turneriella sp.]